MLYRAIKKSNNVEHPAYLSEDEKTAWENSPIVRGKYRFEVVPERPKTTTAPFEAKDVAPKNQNDNISEHKTRKK